MTARRLAIGLRPSSRSAPAASPAAASAATTTARARLLGLDDARPTTTRVEVVEGQGDGGKGFDPQAIFKNEGQGVVTVISLFGSGGLDSIARRRGRRRRLGLRAQRRGRDRHQRARRHAGRGRGRPEGARGLRRVRRRQPRRGEDRRPGPERRRRAAQDRPEGPRRCGRCRSGSSDEVQVGEPVAAIGSPFGERQSLSVGVVSAIDRDIQSLNGDFAIPGAIQTDAAINPGNSGGPLVDADGKVIGINQQIKTNSGGGEGVGFAVPVDVVKRSLGALRETGDAAVRLPRRRLRAAVPAARRALRPAGRQGRVGAGGPAGHAGRQRRASAAAAATPASRSRATRRAATSSPRSRAR